MQALEREKVNNAAEVMLLCQGLESSPPREADSASVTPTRYVTCIGMLLLSEEMQPSGRISQCLRMGDFLVHLSTTIE